MKKSFLSQFLSLVNVLPDSPRSQKQRGSLNFQLAKRVFSYSFASPVLLVTVYVILFVSSMLSTYNPGLGEQLVYILSQENRVDQLTSVIIEKFTIELILGGLECAQTYFQFLLSRKVERKMQEEFYGSLLEKDVDYYENKKIGELTSKLTGDLMSLRSLAISDMSGMFSKISSMVGSLVFMMSISPRLVLTFLVLLAPRIGLIWFFKDYFRESNKVITKLKTDATSIVTETFFNIKTVKSFSTEEKEFKKYTKKLDEYGEKNYENTKKELYYRMAMNLLKTLLFSTVALQGAYIVIDGGITAFQLSRFISYSRSLSMSFLMIEGNIKRILTSLGNAERVFKELDARPKIDPKAGKVVLEKGIVGDITFKDVTFSYPSKKDVKVLKNINLEIKKGEHVAIVGESGGGKTTFTSLIQRLYDPTKGEICIGNRNLKEFDLKWLHSRMGVISQDPALFSGTIEENVVYGVDMYSDEDVDKAITKAYMKKFVDDKEQFPEGLQTHVGERGNKLSGGQRQRVAIARALIKKPDLLVFDEATSALDSESEHQIMKGLEQLLKNKEHTVIVIAHRLSTIMHCDKIVVCQNGEIAEIGNHQELIEKSGIYKNLVEKQFFSLKEKIK